MEEQLAELELKGGLDYDFFPSILITEFITLAMSYVNVHKVMLEQQCIFPLLILNRMNTGTCLSQPEANKTG